MQIVINEQLKNKLSSEEQEARLRKAQFANSANSSPTAKNSLTNSLIQTGTLNKNKFLRLFMSNKSTTNKLTSNNSKSTNDKISNKINNDKNNDKSNSTNKTNNSVIITKTNTAKANIKPAPRTNFISRNKNMNNSTNKTISTISGGTNKAINVAS